MTEHKGYEPEAYYGDYDKELKWPKVAVFHPKTEHNPYPFIMMSPATKNAHGQWHVEPYNDNKYEKIGGGFICHAAPPDYPRWYASAVRDFREYPPTPNHVLWDVVADLDKLSKGEKTVVDYLSHGVNPFTWDGYHKVTALVNQYIKKQRDIEWEKNINAQKMPLVERLKGNEWLEPDTAREIMSTCVWRNKEEPSPWTAGVMIEKPEIKYKGKWLHIARCDLAGQCPTTRHKLDGTAEKLAVWLNSVAYGVVVTDDAWYVIDSFTDG